MDRIDIYVLRLGFFVNLALCCWIPDECLRFLSAPVKKRFVNEENELYAKNMVLMIKCKMQAHSFLVDSNTCLHKIDNILHLFERVPFDSESIFETHQHEVISKSQQVGDGASCIGVYDWSWRCADAGERELILQRTLFESVFRDISNMEDISASESLTMF